MSNSWKLFDNVEEDLKDNFTWWIVDERGNITYKGHTGVYISIESLTSGNMLSHIFSKVRNETEALANSEFYFAFLKALENAGYKRIIIDVTNIHNPIIFEK